MDEQNEYKTPQKGYGKRPMWQWVAIYVVVGAIVYGAIWYFFMRDSGGTGGGLY